MLIIIDVLTGQANEDGSFNVNDDLDNFDDEDENDDSRLEYGKRRGHGPQTLFRYGRDGRRAPPTIFRYGRRAGPTYAALQEHRRRALDRTSSAAVALLQRLYDVNDDDEPTTIHRTASFRDRSYGFRSSPRTGSSTAYEAEAPAVDDDELGRSSETVFDGERKRSGSSRRTASTGGGTAGAGSDRRTASGSAGDAAGGTTGAAGNDRRLFRYGRPALKRQKADVPFRFGDE